MRAGPSLPQGPAAHAATLDARLALGEKRPLMPVKPPDLTRAAYNHLARYAASSGHLRTILTRRLKNWARREQADASAHLPLVDNAIDACRRAGLLDDGAYAASRAALLAQRGWPARRIAASLAAKGVARPEVEAALAARPDDADDAAASRYAARRRFGPWRLRDRTERRQRDIAAMVRAGFSPSLARRVIDGEPS